MLIIRADDARTYALVVWIDRPTRGERPAHYFSVMLTVATSAPIYLPIPTPPGAVLSQRTVVSLS